MTIENNGNGDGQGDAPAGADGDTGGANPHSPSGLPQFAIDAGLDDKGFAALKAKNWITEDGQIKTADMVKGYTELEKRFYKPLEGYDPKNPSAWDGWDRLGAADKADAYLSQFQVPEGMEIDNGLMDVMRQAAIENKVPVAMMDRLGDALVGKLAADAQAGVEAMEARAAQLDQAMQQTFGEHAEERTANAQAAFRALSEEIGPLLGDAAPDTFAQLNEQLGDKGFVLMFDAIASLMGDDKLLRHKGDVAAGTEDAITQQIDALRADKDFMQKYENRGERGHDEAVAQLMNLYQKRNTLKKQA